MHRLLAPGSLLLVALASGCNNNVDRASAQKVMSSALTGTVAADGQVVSLSANPLGGAVELTLTNPGGHGTATVNGTVAKNGVDIDTAVDVVFHQWTDALDDITLDGSLHESGRFSAPLPLTGEVQLSGALAASGSVSGDVDFDLQGSYSPTGFSVSGDVGGQSMSGAVQVSAH